MYLRKPTLSGSVCRGFQYTVLAVEQNSVFLLLMVGRFRSVHYLHRVHGEGRAHILLYPPQAWFRSAQVPHVQQYVCCWSFPLPVHSRRHSPPTPCHHATMLLCSRHRRSFAGAASALVTYPLDLARARLAVGHSRKVGGTRRRRYAQDSPDTDGSNAIVSS